MKKIILFASLFFATFLNANNSIIDISKNESIPIYKTIGIATDIKNIEDAITNPAKFREQTYFRRYLQFHKTNKDSWFKIDIENSSLSNLTRMLYVKWQNVDIDFYLVENDKVIYKNSLLSYKNFMISDPFDIKKDSNMQLYLNVKLIKGIDDFIYLYIVSPQEIPNLITEKERFHNGIFLGLLIAMMMYNFFMFSSMRIKSYLYLGLYQLTVSIYISDMRYYLMTFFYDTLDISYWGLRVVFIGLSFILSILFTKEFLKTKENMPLINNLLNIFLIFYVVSLTNINVIIYVEALYIIFLFAGFYSLKQGNRYALYYILGFSPKIAFFIYVNIARGLELDVNIVYQNVIQILAVMEAFALSMALYLQLKQTVGEKEKAQQEVHEKEKLMIEQSRFAIMGEMIGNIAHQWRQPLNNISSILVNISFRNDLDKLDKEFIKEKIDQSNKQLEYMSKTIEDFRNFFKTNAEKRYFSAKEVCNESIELMSAALTSHQIKLNKDVRSDFLFEWHSGEINQVILILLSNAKDALTQSKKDKKIINITIDKKIISIEDNAGGIDNSIIHKIFEPYFSTKGKSAGTGLGLYIAKVIVEERNNAILSVENTKEGAKFTLKF